MLLSVKELIKILNKAPKDAKVVIDIEGQEHYVDFSPMIDLETDAVELVVHTDC